MPKSSAYRLKALAISFALLVGSTLSFGATPEVGQKAPDFTLSTPDGHRLSLYGTTKTETVVLVVLRGYPGYQCPYCVRQVHDFVRSADKFAARGAQVLLVYPGPPAALDDHAREFLAKQNPLPANIHLVIDPDYKFTNQYDLRWNAPHETAYPSTFVISRNNTVVSRKISHEHGERATAAEVVEQLQNEGASH